MPVQNLAHAKKRRSTRLDQAIPLTVGGADAFRAPYLDHVSTVTISCHGCRYQSKYDVLPGDVVFLELNQPEQKRTTTHTIRARVKCIERMVNKDRPFEIAVELEAPGNVWGVSFPPEDWFPVQKVQLAEPPKHRQVPSVVSETKPARAALVKEAVRQVSLAEKNDAAAQVQLSPLLAQLVSGLGEQIQQMASEAAAAAILKEKGRLLEDFRAQLQREATQTLARVLSASQQELTRRALGDLNKAHEAAARTTQERWTKQVEQNLATATEGIIAQGNELSHRIESMAASTIERLQRHMETLRRDSVDHFVSRLREQLAPVLENAQSTLQRLAAYERELKAQSESSCALFEGVLEQTAQKSVAEAQEKIQRFEKQFEKQFETSVNDRLGKAHGYLQSLVAQTADHVKNALKEKTAEISREFAGELEAAARSYFESVNQVIAEIPNKTAIRIRSRD